jgi:acetylornithine/succinyldiaminopimelate/putrescine aminotransferase
MYNLGHRHSELLAALTEALGGLDIGNRHFPSPAGAALAEALVTTGPAGTSKVLYATSGAEARSLAVDVARHSTGRSRIVDGELTLEALRDELRPRDVAAVVVETSSAPRPAHIRGIRALCDTYGARFVADEVETGLMRTGELWAVDKYDVIPDLLVAGEGLSGGLFPIAAVLVGERCVDALEEEMPGVSSGTELGCVVGLKALEISNRPETRLNVHDLAERFDRGLYHIKARHPDWLVRIRQNGVVIRLEFNHPVGAKLVMRRLYEHGIWASSATGDPQTLRFDLGVLVHPALAEEILQRTEAGIAEAHSEVHA